MCMLPAGNADGVAASDPGRQWQQVASSLTAVCAKAHQHPDLLARAQEQHVFGGVALIRKQTVRHTATLQDEKVNLQGK